MGCASGSVKRLMARLGRYFLGNVPALPTLGKWTFMPVYLHTTYKCVHRHGVCVHITYVCTYVCIYLRTYILVHISMCIHTLVHTSTGYRCGGCIALQLRPT